jgi:hypothetical protein
MGMRHTPIKMRIDQRISMQTLARPQHTPQPESLFHVFSPPPHGQLLLPADAGEDPGPDGQATSSQLSVAIRSPNLMSLIGIENCER